MSHCGGACTLKQRDGAQAGSQPGKQSFKLLQVAPRARSRSHHAWVQHAINQRSRAGQGSSRPPSSPPPTRVGVHQQLGEGHVCLQDVQQLEAQAGAVDGEHIACDRLNSNRTRVACTLSQKSCEQAWRCAPAQHGAHARAAGQCAPRKARTQAASAAAALRQNSGCASPASLASLAQLHSLRAATTSAEQSAHCGRSRF